MGLVSRASHYCPSLLKPLVGEFSIPLSLTLCVGKDIPTHASSPLEMTSLELVACGLALLAWAVSPRCRHFIPVL